MSYIYNQWTKKQIFEGTKEECEKYLDKNNIIGYNYSMLLIKYELV